MRKHFLFLFMMFASLGVKAQSDSDPAFLEIMEVDDTQVLFPIRDNPEIGFSDGRLEVKTATADYSGEFSKVRHFRVMTFAEATAIKAVSGDGLQVDFNAGGIIVRGLKPNDTVALYTIGGALLEKKSASGDGCVVMSLEPQPKGVYVLRTKNANYKIRK